MTTHQHEDGSTRWSHYGTGRQPWDDIQDEGWGPEFCAGNVLKYLRRAKDAEKDLVKACWYYQRLLELSRAERLPRKDPKLSEASSKQRAVGRACGVLVRLCSMLTTEEKEKVRA